MGSLNCMVRQNLRSLVYEQVHFKLYDSQILAECSSSAIAIQTGCFAIACPMWIDGNCISNKMLCKYFHDVDCQQLQIELDVAELVAFLTTDIAQFNQHI